MTKTALKTCLAAAILILLSAILYCTYADDGIQIDETHFPDQTFREYVQQQFDSNHDGVLSESEQNSVVSINVSGMTALKSLKGIEYFPNLESLDAHAPIINNESTWNVRFGNISDVDVSKNSKLQTLDLANTDVSSLDLSNNPELAHLDLAGTKISSMAALTGIHKENIRYFHIDRSSWQGELDVTDFNNLEDLDASGCSFYADDYSLTHNITQVKGLANKSKLEKLNLSGVGGEFDLTGCDHLKNLDLSQTSFDGSNLTGFPQSGLVELNLGSTQIESMPDLSGSRDTLQSLDVSGDFNLGEAPDVSEFTQLKSLNLSGMGISELGSCKSSSVETLNLSSNPITGELDLSGFPALKVLHADNCCSYDDDDAALEKITGLNGPLKELSANNTKLDISSYLENGYSNVEKLDLRGSKINGTIDLSHASKLKYLYLDGCNVQGTLDVSNCPNLIEIHAVQNPDLKAITGLENCPDLKDVYAYDTSISSIDFSKNPEMIRIDLCRTPLTAINVENMKHLFALNVEDTKVTSIDVSHNPELYELYLTNDKIERADVSHNPELVHLRLSGTGVTSVDTANNPKLAALYIENTKVSSLDLSNNPKMFELFMDNTPISSIDVSNCKGLQHLNANETKLKEINIRKNKALSDIHINGTEITSLDLSHHPNLRQIECNNTKIKRLDLSGLPKLWKLYINDSSIENLKNLDLSAYTNLDTLECKNAGIQSLKVPASLSSLYCDGNQLPSLELTGCGAYDLSLSPQKATLLSDQPESSRSYSLKDLGLDSKRVRIENSDKYTYDQAAGTITFKDASDKSFTYDYITNTNKTNRLMKVNASIKYQERYIPVITDPLKTDRQKAIDDIKSMVDESRLTADQKAEIEKIIADAETSIQNASSKEDIQKIQTKAEDQIETVITKKNNSSDKPSSNGSTNYVTIKAVTYSSKSGAVKIGAKKYAKSSVQKLKYGKKVNLSAKAKKGYKFSGWYKKNSKKKYVRVSKSRVYRIKAVKNATYKAVFKKAK